METCSIVVALDTEGYTHAPWSLQFSITPGSGYVIKALDRPSLERFGSWLNERPDVVVGHNWLHDFGICRSLGIDVPEDKVFDTMIAAYLLCVEPQSLKSNAYRNAGMEMSEYSEIIGDSGQIIALEYLLQVAGMEWPNLEPHIVHEGGKPKVKKTQNIGKTVKRILSDIESGKTLKDGSLVDPRARWKRIDREAKAPVIAVMGDMREPSLDDVPEALAVSYSARDADATRRIYPVLKAKLKAMDLEFTSDMDHAILPMVDRAMERGAYMAPVEFWDRLESACERQMAAAHYEIYKLTGRDLNPASGDQVADLLYGPKDKGGLGLTPLMMTDGGSTGVRRGSTNDKCLEDLMFQAPVVEHIQSYREAQKLLGTYVEPLRDAARTPDRRAHTTFKVTRQATGRITTAEPINLLSIPVRSELGRGCRDGFTAPEGFVLYDADESQIEMRLFAHESRDENLCKAFIDDIDVHVQTAAQTFGVSMSAVEKWQRQAGKIVGFAIINGITPQGLLNQMILYRATRKDGSRWTEDDCAMMLREWFRIYPGGKRYQLECVEAARTRGYARESIGGRIRYLPNIWSDVRHVREAAERESYFPIQAGAAAILKLAMARMWQGLRGLRGDVEPVLFVHDETLWEVRDDPEIRDLVAWTVQDAFENTVRLRVPLKAEGKFGDSWGSAH